MIQLRQIGTCRRSGLQCCSPPKLSPIVSPTMPFERCHAVNSSNRASFRDIHCRSGCDAVVVQNVEWNDMARSPSLKHPTYGIRSCLYRIFEASRDRSMAGLKPPESGFPAHGIGEIRSIHWWRFERVRRDRRGEDKNSVSV